MQNLTSTETQAQAEQPELSEQSATPVAAPTKPAPSEARLRANRENATKSTGPRTAEGKSRSALNATRHGILAQVIHLPEEELAAYDAFTAAYIQDLAPQGAVERQLAHACADLQFRLHRLAAAEHNLFAIGHQEQGDHWETGHPESHTALAFAETLRRSKDPLGTLTIYEQLLSRRFLQTLKQLQTMQATRRAEEQQQLAELYALTTQNPDQRDHLEPADFGFVCSTQSWTLYLKRRRLLDTPPQPTKHPQKRRAQAA